MKNINKETYRNIFAEMGIAQESIETRLEEIIITFLYGFEE